MNSDGIIGVDGKILKIIPISVYQGKTYTQDIFVEFSDGKKAALQDSRMVCNQKMVNAVFTFKIHLEYQTAVKKNREKIQQIYPVEPVSDNYQGPYAMVSGCIKKIVDIPGEEDQKDYCIAILDVGIGTVQTEISKMEGGDGTFVNEGDCISIDHACMSIDDIELLTD